MVVVDQNSPIPYYVQVKEALRQRIQQGEWMRGDQLPVDLELCQMFGVSRTVIRQALNELVNEGLVIRRKGKGTFVAEPKIGESLVQKLTGFYQDMVDRAP
jgi:GntR family transcriptional regulator